MRFLLGLCALLVIANVVAFFWPTSSDQPAHVYAEREDVNPNFLSLNKEVEARYYQSDAVNVGAQLPQVGESCYRLGPFMFESNYELAQAVLFNAQLDFNKSTREAQQSLVHRVFLGPFASQAEIDDARVELKRNSILDHFVRNSDGQGSIISLGIYTTQEAADRAVDLFADSLDSIKSQQEEILLPESHWLHFVLAEDGAIRQQLSVMDWGETAVKLGKFECFQG
ncbi:MAG: SPOR domain-containing protein [Acidiferrobacterales bacterium]|nr:SPOR domain-containing protein [Acidiferrobacterales bacterium]